MSEQFSSGTINAKQKQTNTGIEGDVTNNRQTLLAVKSVFDLSKICDEGSAAKVIDYSFEMS